MFKSLPTGFFYFVMAAGNLIRPKIIMDFVFRTRGACKMFVIPESPWWGSNVFNHLQPGFRLGACRNDVGTDFRKGLTKMRFFRKGFVPSLLEGVISAMERDSGLRLLEKCGDFVKLHAFGKNSGKELGRKGLPKI